MKLMDLLERFVCASERQVLAFQEQADAIIRQSAANVRHLNSVAEMNERNARAKIELDVALQALNREIQELREKVETRRAPPNESEEQKP